MKIKGQYLNSRVVSSPRKTMSHPENLFLIRTQKRLAFQLIKNYN